ncbi:MAG: GGDEF domain-containing protein [Chloroflexi bacterium]|nr:GGDEF domain-containing protein [Chloroflexota bacterium]
MNLSRLRTLGPTALRVQITVVVVAAALLAAISLTTLSIVRDSARASSRESQAAILSADIHRHALELRLALPADGGRLSAEQALAAREILYHADEDATALHADNGTAATLDILGAVRDAVAALNDHAETGSAVSLADFRLRVSAFERESSALSPQLQVQAAAEQGFLGRTADLAQVGIAAAVILIFVVLGAATWVVSRGLKTAVRRAEAETAALQATTASMARRNSQFQALYQIVTEVTETLSLKYVVQTTIREARRLVSADVVILRLLRGNELVVAGTEQDVDGDVIGLRTIQLGEGLVGRAAKRGKSLRMGADAEATLSDGEGFPGAQSGVVVPLIVGARVVGTLTVWSRLPDLFTAEDEQVLEMMASQVATAVVAADTHELSEHEAHHDPLTGLPNRRQLTRDTRERFTPELELGQALAVAMVDIDHFKRFNDDFGHKVGDVTLQRVAEVLRSAVREGDLVYRYGGEEFTIVLPGTDPEAVRRLLDRVRTAVSGTSLTGEHMEPVGPVTVSMGVAFAPADEQDFERLLKCADSALYQAKWAGRNRVEAYTAAEGELPAAA